MENMYNGVSNMIIALITLVDNTKRHFSGAGLFDVIMGDTKDSSFSVIKAGIQAISNIFNNFFGFLKPGMVEVVALVLMFEQFQTLTKMFLAPSIKNIGIGLRDIGLNFSQMIVAALSPKGIGSLFTNLTSGDAQRKGAFSNTANARIAADIARTQASLGGYKPENVSIFQEVLQGVQNLATGVLNKFKDLANFLLSPFNAALRAVSQGFNLVRSTMQGLAAGTLTLRGAFMTIAQGLQTFKTNFLTNFSGIKQFIVDSFIPNLITSSKRAIMPFTALFSPDISVRQAVRKDWGRLFTSTISHFMGGIGLAFKHLGKLALEFGLALGVMFLARSDFSNPMETAVNKASRRY